jgi:4-amino-4-deoxy-L-arabinose transferase-like glycosyltransferase
MNRRRWNRIGFWLLVLLALFWQLGSRALNEPDEGRAAAIAREMQAQGSWWMPRLYDHAHVNKPPLLYWLLRAAYGLGGTSEWSARLPAALSALATMALTAALARRMRGAGSGLRAAALLLACPLFFAQARVLDYNMVLTAWVTLAFWAAWAWREEGRPHQRALFYLALSLAFLTKGPVGPLLVLMGCLLYRWFPVKGTPWRALWSWPWALGSLAVALAWHVSLALAHPELWSFFLSQELAGRVLTQQHGRSEHLLFYAAILPLSLLPWLPALLRALRGVRGSVAGSAAGRFIWLATGAGLLLFTLAQSKLPTYILPLLPLLCVALAPADDEDDRPLDARFSLLVAAAVPLVVIYYGRSQFGWPMAHLDPATALLPVAALAAAGWIAGRSGGSFWRVWPLVIASFLLTHDLLRRHETRLGAHTSARAVARALASHWQPGDQVALVGRYPRGLGFYFQHPVSVYLEKYPLQIEADRTRVADKDFADPGEVFARFDQTGRVFLVASPAVARERERDARRPVHRLFDDGHHVLISNQP